MRHWGRFAQAACAAGLFVVCWPAALSAASCDDYDAASPALTAQITLTSSDAVDERGDELRSFIATGSLGRVDATVASSAPPGIVRAVSAVPRLSRFSPRYGERLKGIAIAVSLKRGATPVTVAVRLRQVCARYFRDTFLYY